MMLRSLNHKSLTRIALGVIFFGVGLCRVILGKGFPGQPVATFLNEFGLMILGVLMVIGLFSKMSKTSYLLFGALLYAILMQEGLLTPEWGMRIAMVVILFFIGSFIYKFFRVTFIEARRDTLARKAKRAYVGPLDDSKFLPSDSPYRSHLENKEFLLRDMQKSKANSLVGHEGCWGTRWHFGPLWFENFFGDMEPPHGSDGPLRVVIWQPVRDVPASRGWRHTRMLKYNHMTGFETLTKEYWKNWSDHARRHRNKWLHATEWEIYHPAPAEWFRAYRGSGQNILLRFYFTNLTKQLMLNHAKDLIFWGVRHKDDPSGKMLAGFISHDIPESKQSRHLASFILKEAKDTPIGIGVMDTWHQDALAKGFEHLDFGVFWMPGDPESWKGFSRFKGQFGITYIQYPAARLRRAGSWKHLFK